MRRQLGDLITQPVQLCDGSAGQRMGVEWISMASLLLQLRRLYTPCSEAPGSAQDRRSRRAMIFGSALRGRSSRAPRGPLGRRLSEAADSPAELPGRGCQAKSTGGLSGPVTTASKGPLNQLCANGARIRASRPSHACPSPPPDAGSYNGSTSRKTGRVFHWVRAACDPRTAHRRTAPHRHRVDVRGKFGKTASAWTRTMSWAPMSSERSGSSSLTVARPFTRRRRGLSKSMKSKPTCGLTRILPRL